VTLHRRRKLDKEFQSYVFFLSSLMHSFIVFQSVHSGQEYHDANMQAWLYRGTRGLPECHGFGTGFESRGAHKSEEQWNVRDTRV
jgi:hypothetical protein